MQEAMSPALQDGNGSGPSGPQAAWTTSPYRGP